ncbi:Gfo/Idh/MocA family oxidoreductase [Silvimonas sp. JCM 19000]
MNRPVRLGLIGCGVAARELHWPALQHCTDDIQLVAVCNRTAQKAQHFAAMAGGVDWYTDMADLLARPDIDAVDIVLPATDNLSATRAALQAGKHILVEKPLAPDADQAAEMLALAAQYPQYVCMVAENFRYASAFSRIQAWLVSGRAGAVYALNWNAMMSMQPDNRYLVSGWRSGHEFPGGLLLDAGVHYVAVARDLLGDIVRATLSPTQTNPQLGRFDGGALTLQSAAGATAQINLYFSSHTHQQWQLTVLAENGAATYDGRTLVLQDPSGQTRWERDDDDGYMAEFRAFAHAIRIQRAPRSDFDQAWRDMQILTSTLAQPQRWIDFA